MSTLASSGAAPGSRDNGHSSAPVLEFVCLFTHDLRRKQKRWQDGRLKYHTFNKRVMVYDERGNFIGDMYWRRDWEFDEGEEIELERGGVIVQVAECVGRQNQDLSELIDKRAKEKEQRAAARPAVPHVPMHTPLSVSRTPVAQRDHFQTRHRPLNQLLGTPSGHHGRALVPTESPYEKRHTTEQTPDEESSSRAQKRRRQDDMPSSKMGYAQALFGAPLTLSGAPLSSAPIRRPALPRPQPRIDYSSSQEDGLSDSRSAGNRRSPVPEPRTIQRRVEPPARAPVTTSKPVRPPVWRETETHVSDEDQGNVPLQNSDQSTSRRGVSSHFTTASEESRKRASLLQRAGERMGQTRVPPPIGTERRAGRPMETPIHKRTEPEPITIPDDEEEDDYNMQDVPDPEEEPPVSRNTIMNATRLKRNALELARERPREQDIPKRSSGTLYKSNSFAHSTTTDDESETPAPVQVPDPAPPAEPPVETPKEPRTELRIKSRGRRGLLVLSEMAKEAIAPAKKRKKRRDPTPEPEEPIENIIDEKYEIPEEDFGQDLNLDPEPPRAASPKPAIVNKRVKETAPVSLDSSDPFSTQAQLARKAAREPVRQAAPRIPDSSDPFSTQAQLLRERAAQTSRKPVAADPDDSDLFASPEPGTRKNSRRDHTKEAVAEEEPSMDIDGLGDNDLPTFETSSPEPVQRNNRKNRTANKPKPPVYDIPDDTDEEQISLHEPEPSPPKPKKTTKTREPAKKKTKPQPVEEENNTEDSDELPKTRTTRTRKRKQPQKAPSEDEEEEEEEKEEERPSKAKTKNKRARAALAFLDEQSSEEEEEEEDLPMPMPPPKTSRTRTSKASKASTVSKPAKAKPAPRLGKKLKSTVKSREVFGFVMSSSPPPPNFGFGAVAAHVNRPAPPADEDNDSRPEVRPVPAISNPTGHVSGPSYNENPVEAPPRDTHIQANLGTNSFQRRTSIPDIQPHKESEPEPVERVVHTALSSRGGLNQQGLTTTSTTAATGARSETNTAVGTRGSNAAVQANNTSRDIQQENPQHDSPEAAVRRPEQQKSIIPRAEEHIVSAGLHTQSRNDAPVPAPAHQGRANTAGTTDTAVARPENLTKTPQEDTSMPPPPLPVVQAVTTPAAPPQVQNKTPTQAQPRPPPSPVAPPVTATASGIATTAGKATATVPPALPPVQAATPLIAATTAATTAASIPSIPTAKPATVTTTATASTSVAPVASVIPMGPPPRIPNPASRGRKAALKSDAKGQTPQSILPPAEPLSDRSNLLVRNTSNAVRSGGSASASGGGQEDRPKLKMTFPGFVSAREHEGGPWSREAHDLLEFGWPGG